MLRNYKFLKTVFDECISPKKGHIATERAILGISLRDRIRNEGICRKTYVKITALVSA